MFDPSAVTVSNAMLLAFVLTAVVTDLRRGRIYNWTTYPGMLVAVVLNAAGTAAEQWLGEGETARQIVGWIGIRESLLGFLVCGAALVICFVFFDIRGGDVKLIAMIGAFVGMFRGIEVILWTFVLGGATGLILLIWRYGLWRVLKRWAVLLWSVVRLQGISHLVGDHDDVPKTALYLAPSAAVAVILVQSGLLRSIPLF